MKPVIRMLYAIGIVSMLTCSYSYAQDNATSQNNKPTNAAPESGFAGFGRVGRSHFSEVDYRARWAVIVGVNRFKNKGLDQLDNAVNDAGAVRDILRDEFGYAEERIIFLTDQVKDERGELKDKNPIKKADIIQAFESLASQDIRSNDAVLFFFAGHGKSDKEGTYLAGYDAVSDDTSTWVDAVDLKKRLRLLPARHRLIILDSCYAGSILDVELSKGETQADSSASASPSETTSSTITTLTKKVGGKRSDGDEGTLLDDNISYYLQQPAFFAITSGRDQPVGDASQAKPDHSPFTTAFLQVLQERANSARQGDVFTARELAVRVESRVRSGQTPDWGRLEGSRGDFVFKPTRNRLTPREIAERDDYIIRINFVQAAIKLKNWDRALQLLDSCPVEQRLYEWHHLRALADDSNIIWRGHKGSIRALAITDDGKQVISGGDDGKVNVWNADQAGEPIRSFIAHQGRVDTLTVTKDGKMLFTGGSDKTIRVWNVTDGFKPMESIPIVNSPSIVAVSPDGNTRAWATHASETKGFEQPRIELSSFNKQTQSWRKDVLDAGEIPITSLTFSSDGKFLVSSRSQPLGEFGDLKVWDMQNRKLLPLNLGNGKRGGIQSLAWRPDGKRLAASFTDGNIRIWDTTRWGNPVVTFEAHQNGVGEIAFSPDGKRLASFQRHYEVLIESDDSIKVWNADTGDMLFALRQHHDMITAVTFSPDGRFIFSASHDGTVRKWRAEPVAAHTRSLTGHQLAVAALAISADSRWIVSIGVDQYKPSATEVKIWNADKGGPAVRNLPNQSQPIHAIAFHPDGKRFVTGSGNHLQGGTGDIKVWQTEGKAEPLWTFTTREWEKVTSLAFTPDGKRIVAGLHQFVRLAQKPWSREEYAVCVWDAEVGGSPLFRIIGAHTPLLSTDGKTIAATTTYGTVKVWHADRGGEPIRALDGPISAGDFSIDGKGGPKVSADGRRSVSGGDTENKGGGRAVVNPVWLWDAQRGGESLLAIDSARSPVVISADGKRIVSFDKDGKTIVIRDANKR